MPREADRSPQTSRISPGDPIARRIDVSPAASRTKIPSTSGADATSRLALQPRTRRRTRARRPPLLCARRTPHLDRPPNRVEPHATIATDRRERTLPPARVKRRLILKKRRRRDHRGCDQPGRALTAQGHRRFNRAIERGSPAIAETSLRELAPVPRTAADNCSPTLASPGKHTPVRKGSPCPNSLPSRHSLRSRLPSSS